MSSMIPTNTPLLLIDEILETKKEALEAANFWSRKYVHTMCYIFKLEVLKDDQRGFKIALVEHNHQGKSKGSNPILIQKTLKAEINFEGDAIGFNNRKFNAKLAYPECDVLGFKKGDGEFKVLIVGS